MSNKSESDVEVNVEKLDSDELDEHLRSSAAILHEMLKDREPAVDELIKGDLPAPTAGNGHACKHCGKLYKSQATLQMHTRLKHPNDRPGVEVRCVSCDKTYASLLSLQKHQRYMHRYSQRCKACYRTFETHEQLAEHATSCVRSERPCPTCGKMYESQLSLRNHVKYKHPEVKANWCNICRRTFRTDRGLVNHVAVIHLGQIECGSCDRKFTTVAGLQSHVLYKHSANGHRCVQCRKVFASHGSMSRHLTKNHNVVVYDCGKYCCGVCDASFQASNSLIQHVINHHTGIREANENK